jgi:hypothetical protein
MQKQFHLKPIAAALMAALVVSGPVLANPVIQEQVSVTPGRQIDLKDEATISAMGGKVLRHIGQARIALQGDKPDTKKAGSQLEQTSKLLDIIHAALPTTRIKDSIWVDGKNLKYENTDEVKPGLIPLYASVGEIADFTAADKSALVDKKGDKSEYATIGEIAENEIAKADKKGDKPEAVEPLKESGDTLWMVEVDLPFNNIRDLVNQAATALNKGDTNAAEMALAEAEDSVVYVSQTFQSPMTRVKDSIQRAWEDFSSGEKATAKQELSSAIGYLQDAAKSSDKVLREVATNLAAKVQNLRSLVDSDSGDFAQRAENVWHRVEALSQRAVDSIDAGWQRLRADNDGKQQLIDARLQLELARIDRFGGGDDAIANVELAQAKGHLDAALKQVATPKQAQVKKLNERLSELQNSLASGDSANIDASTFNELQSRLTTLIHQV